MSLIHKTAACVFAATLMLTASSCSKTPDSTYSGPPTSSKPLTGFCRELATFASNANEGNKSDAERLASYDSLTSSAPAEVKPALTAFRPMFVAKMTEQSNADAEVPEYDAAKAGKAFADIVAYLDKSCGVS